jgi:hypothetical protein
MKRLNCVENHMITCTLICTIQNNKVIGQSKCYRFKNLKRLKKLLHFLHLETIP